MQGYQIIGIDLADEKFKDMSAINSICMRCNSVIETKTFQNNDNKPQVTIFKNCPVCGIKIERHIIREEY